MVIPDEHVSDMLVAWGWNGMESHQMPQGAGRLLWPLVAGIIRLAVAAGGGWVASRWFGACLFSLFPFIAVAFVLSATIMAASIRSSIWREASSQPAIRP
jgi:hypothetical protein